MSETSALREPVRGGPARTISIVIPAYNEEDNLPVVLDACLGVGVGLNDELEIVVVDDLSTDRTGRLADEYAAREPQVRVIHNERNLGCHPSELAGFRAATGDVLFFIPADRQIMPDQLLVCLPALEQADYVCTNRVPRADPWHRRLVSRLYNESVRRIARLDLHDVDSGVLMRRDVFDAIGNDVDARSAFVSVELVVRAAQAGFRVVEVPIEHHPRVAGRARGLNLRDFARVPLDLLRFSRLLRRLRRSDA